MRRGSWLVRRIAFLLAPLLVLLSGCAQTTPAQTTPARSTATLSPRPTPTPPPADLVTGLRVLRVSDFPQNRVAPFERTSTDIVKVRRLYATVLAQPPVPTSGGPLGCPVDFGIFDNMTFLGSSGTLLQASLTGGCLRLTLSAPYGTRMVSDAGALFQQMADALGVPVEDISIGSDMLSTAPVGGPFAPTPTPSVTP